MGNYVDGFVLPLPKGNEEKYREVSERAGKVWMDHGALEYIETIADDVPDGKVTSFPMSVKLEEGESVVFAWIVFESREERDRINKAVMEDPRLADMMDPKAVRRHAHDLGRLQEDRGAEKVTAAKRVCAFAGTPRGKHVGIGNIRKTGKRTHT